MNEFRNCAVLGVPLDEPLIRRFNWKRLGLNPVLCVWEEELEQLPGVDCLVVVLTPTSICSTRFQAAVLRALSLLTRDVPCWVVNLSGGEIPLGVAGLRNCPAAPAELLSPADELIEERRDPAVCSTPH